MQSRLCTPIKSNPDSSQVSGDIKQIFYALSTSAASQDSPIIISQMQCANAEPFLANSPLKCIYVNVREETLAPMLAVYGQHLPGPAARSLSRSLALSLALRLSGPRSRGPRSHPRRIRLPRRQTYGYLLFGAESSPQSARRSRPLA